MSELTNKNAGFAIYHDLVVAAPTGQLFAAVSLSEQLVNWWPFRCTGEPAVGATYNFFFSPEYDWYGEVIKVIPNEAFHVRMTAADPDWTPTSFGFDLSEVEGGRTQLSFWHRGWPACNAHFKRSSFCWAILLQGLKNYVEKGTIVPFAERE
ncbi:MAG: SRPBCC domain-containing protein [Bacteroidota bacterium]